ncbi:POC1 centriolar protein A [Entophlyctis sp. JEL0112]|nr:POC1 centriolar protein A [Entophlyctis sp. JEL0112]
MAVLKAEIIAKLNSAPQDVALSPGSQTALVESDIAAVSSIILPTEAPTVPRAPMTPASSDSAVSDVDVPASISNAATAGTTAAHSTPVVAGSTSVDFYMKREFEDWLNPVSFESDMASYASQYVEGTREWAVDAIGTQFAGDANVVWLNGAAGVGKSLVAYLAATSPPSGFTLLSAFFCKHYDEKKNNAKQLVCRLVYDLACVSPVAFSKLHSLMQQDKDYCTQNPTALSILDKPIVAFSTLFLELLPLLGTSSDMQLSSDLSSSAVSAQASSARYLIVIDALDECGTQGDPTRNELLSLLASLNTGSSNAAAKLPPFVKILTTGRPEADIWRVMESLRTDSLEPTAEANVRDIELFVKHEVSHFPYSLGAQADECCRLLTENSEFVFVAARVLCSQLRSIVDSHHGVDELDLVAVVQHLSASLDDQYSRILDSNINTNDATNLDVYMKFMYVLLAAKIPLDCANIAVLTDLTPAGVQLVISKVRPHGKVTVLHKSVKDFLTSPARCTIPAFYVSLVKANVFVAQRCLAVLNNQLHHNMFELPSASVPVQPKQQELLSILPAAVRYSCLYWTIHILDAANLDGHKMWRVLSATEAVISEFCTQKILQWLEVMAVEKKVGQLMESCTALVKMMESVSGFRGTATSTSEQKKTLETSANNGRKLTETPALGLATELLSDISRLAARFLPALDFNPLHVYQSALTFTPHDTKLYHHYHSFAGGKVTASPDLTWGPLVTSMSGHTGTVTSVAYNHDGSLIASVSEDKTVRVWNPLSGALVSELKGHSNYLTSVAFNHDSSLIASGSWDKTVRVWNPLSGALISELKGHCDWVCSVAFNHDGSLIASGSDDNTARVWNPLSGALVAVLEGHSDNVKSVAFNHDGSMIASGSWDKTVKIWNALNGALVSELSSHSHQVNAVAFNHDGSLIASGCKGNIIQVWNLFSGALISELKGHSREVKSVAFNHDSSLIASGSSDKTVRVWNPLSGALVSELKGHSGSVFSVAYNHDGSFIVSGSWDKTVRVWNPLSSALVSVFEGHSDYVNSVAFNHDGSLIATGSDDNTARVWNPLSGALVSELKGHSNYVTSVAFNHDGSLIASGSDDNTARVWNPLSAALLSVLQNYPGGSVKLFAFKDSLEPLDNTSVLPCLRFSDNSGWMGLGSASNKFLWVPLAPSLEYAFSHSAFACGFPDGKVLICALSAPL